MTVASPVPGTDQPAGPSIRTAMWTTLVAAAVEVGRMPGEPPVILKPALRPSLLARLVGIRPHGPLADPRLEVLRAISASLNRGVVRIGGDLLAAAYEVGWTADDLRHLFPGIALAQAMELH